MRLKWTINDGEQIMLAANNELSGPNETDTEVPGVTLTSNVALAVNQRARLSPATL
jgi:hypothetical protein